MSLIGSELREVWNVLGQRRSQYDFYLERVQIKNFRGIEDLRVEFEYPVSVVAGPNGCGKTTLLLACACAYRQASGSSKGLMPGNAFPNFEDRLRETLRIKLAARSSPTSTSTAVSQPAWHGGAAEGGIESGSSPSVLCMCAPWPISPILRKLAGRWG